MTTILDVVVEAGEASAMEQKTLEACVLSGAGEEDE